MNNATGHKWNQIYQNLQIGEAAPAMVLSENAYLLPQQGKALDVASGLGSNAIFLAQHGLNVDAWDISDVAVTKLNHFSQVNQLTIQATCKDLSQNHTQHFGQPAYDVIMGCHYLDRMAMPLLINSLKPGGLLFYQTFLQAVTSEYNGPGNLLYRLECNELLQFFSTSLRVIFYRENGLIGDTSKGLRNEAMIIAKKPE